LHENEHGSAAPRPPSRLSRARRASYAHDARGSEWNWPPGKPPAIDDKTVCDRFELWKVLCEEIDALNHAKVAMMKKVRAEYGPYHAEALKRAFNLALRLKTSRS
jgi:hypothetical protein